MPSQRLVHVSLVMVTLSVLVGLALMAGLGYFNRLWSDDWCYQRDLEHLGVVGTMGGYFFTGDEAIRGYSTNRYALTLTTALLFVPGMAGTQLIAPLLVALLILGLFLVITELQRGSAIPVGIRLLLSAFLTYFLLAISPARFQVLYWRAGIHYTATPIVGLFMLWILLSAHKARRNWAAYLAVAALGLFGGGLSETGCVYLIVAFGMLLAYTWFRKRAGDRWAQNALPLRATAVAALTLAMIVLIVSPSNDRYRVHVDYPIAPALVPLASLRFAAAFVLQSLRGLPVPHLVLGGFTIALAVLARHLKPARSAATTMDVLRVAALATLISLVLITFIQMPAAYFYGAPLDARGQSLSRFTMLAALASMAWVLGEKIGTVATGWVRILCVLVVATTAVYNTRFVRSTYVQLDGFVRRAQAWDARDTAIRDAVASGEGQIQVPVIDTYEIGTRDLIRSIDMDRWITNCATEYYGAEAFRAIPP